MMLLQFNFKNYKSFKDYTSFDMTALDLKEFSERVIYNASEKVLPVSVIFGANLSGKSNFTEALAFMKEFVLRSENSDKVFGELLKTYANSNSESTFEVYLLDIKNQTTYNYGFSLNKQKILSEWLYLSDPDTETECIFNRNENTVELPVGSFRNHDIKNISISNRSLILSSAHEIDNSYLNYLYNWFERLSYLYLSQPRNKTDREELVNYLIDHPFEPDLINNYLSSFYPEVSVKVKKDKKIFVIHRIEGDEQLELELDSDTQSLNHLIDLYYRLITTLNTGSLLIVDDFDLNLHPLTLRNLLLPFFNSYTNPNNAQLIITLHNTWFLSKQFLRRDEIWFTEKDKRGISSLFSLSDIKTSNNSLIDENRGTTRWYMKSVSFLSKFKYDLRRTIGSIESKGVTTLILNSNTPTSLYC